MLDKEHKQLDGITVSTPDHMHAPVTMARDATRPGRLHSKTADADRARSTSTYAGRQGNGRCDPDGEPEPQRSGLPIPRAADSGRCDRQSA